MKTSNGNDNQEITQLQCVEERKISSNATHRTN